MPDPIKLLIIDDCEDDCVLYRRALSADPDVRYAIEEAHDGDAALRCIAAHAPDCILLDYSLPGLNGVEVLKRIRAEHPFVPVLMLTGQGSETIAVSAMQQGAQNYISKSAVAPEQIQRAIQIAIAHCVMEKGLHEQRTSLEIFTRALAHDLKEPVRTIRSFLGVLGQTETLTTQGCSYFTFIESAADRMGALIDAVYDYTRLDATAPKSKRQRCSANKLFNDAKEDISELITERGATVSCESLPEVEADPARLRQVLQNLICNAIHHAPNAPVVTVAAEERSDHWRFSVTDNGPGIDPESRDRIFEPFARMSSSNSSGLGMGLAICRRIVESHGGKIWCESAPCGGARFLFTLAKSDGAATGTAVPPPRAAAVPGEADSLATILVVDDNDAAIELARIMLVQQSNLQCHILCANSGEQALGMLRDVAATSRNVDIMLLDINMPRMDGFKLLQLVRADATLPKPAIIMCSTSCYDKDVERAQALGASGYMEKPPQLASLRPLLTKVPGVRLNENGSSAALLRVQ
jgi:signal transduction histidine kinase